MLKFLGLMLLSIGAFSAAHAATVTLYTSPCSQASYCSEVINDAGSDITVVYAKQYGRLSAMIDGVLWDSGIYALPRNGSDVLVSVPLYDGAGNVLYATITFTGGQVTGPCRQSGRVCVFPHAPRYLDNGTLTW